MPAVLGAVGEASVVFASAEEALWATGASSVADAAEALGATCPSVVRVGAAGALVAEDGKVVSVPGFSATVVDLLGAGDAWDAGAIRALMAGASLVEAARAGNAAAALSAAGTGARAMPDAASLDALLAPRTP
jgi:sugar/nucleoside kinase (ribokinase family)